MEERLHDRVIGQDEAIESVSNAIRRARAGLQEPNRPLGSFLFLGPTGVGKTELAKALAEFLFDSDGALVRLDMTEYMERHAVSRMIGAPPGYVGHEEGGYLTEAVRRRPYAVILLDEIEKAHQDIFNILLQILDDGRLTDGKGRTVDFSNTVIIMTSNIGSGDLQRIGEIGFDAARDRVFEQMRQVFRPEFINRVDDAILFSSLSPEQLAAIVKIQLRDLNGRLANRGMILELTDAARQFLAEQGYDPVYGARPLKRIFQKMLENPLATAVLSGEFSENDTIGVDVDPSKALLVFRRVTTNEDPGTDEDAGA
jgi:ATP-dependent Clp protease ATP-binding subunit ClpB